MTPEESSETSMPNVLCMRSYQIDIWGRFFAEDYAAVTWYYGRKFLCFSIAFFIDSSPLPSLS